MILRIIFFFRFKCICKYRKRREYEERRDWIKDISCQYHWMKSDYYIAKYHD